MKMSGKGFIGDLLGKLGIEWDAGYMEYDTKCAGGRF